MSELTRGEAARAAEAMKHWPNHEVREVFKLPPNERDLICLLVGELDAIPCDPLPPPGPNTIEIPAS